MIPKRVFSKFDWTLKILSNQNGSKVSMGIWSKKIILNTNPEDVDPNSYHLKRSLSSLDLILFGIGVVIGAGLFSITGIAASQNAGSAIVLSFLIAAFGCALAGLCYSEMATMIPISGSAYTYAYASMGELIVWLMGWSRESARVNILMVFIKLAVVFIFIIFGLFYIQLSNYQTFILQNTGKFGEFGFSGIMRAAGVVFFSYVGFDSISTTIQETKTLKNRSP